MSVQGSSSRALLSLISGNRRLPRARSACPLCLARAASTALIESARPRRAQTRAVAPLDQADYDLIELTVPERPFPPPLSPSFAARKPDWMGQGITIALQYLRPFGGVKYLLPITYMPVLYEPCAERASSQYDFWCEELGLPEDFDTWHKVTNLHIWLLVVRFRRFNKDIHQSLRAELNNVYATDVDLRLKTRHGIRMQNDQRKYSRHAFAVLAATLGEYDDALFRGDWAMMEAFVRRFMEGKLVWPRPRAPMPPPPEAAPALPVVEGAKPLSKQELADARQAAFEADLAWQMEDERLELETSGIPEARVVLALERLVQYVRQELKRMEDIPDDKILNMDPDTATELVRFADL